jgi:NAD-reducing hydrogenase large subunit
MSRTVLIQPVTRIEGHAKISIQLDDAGRVESARFHFTEFRGFEKLCEGRPFQEMPGLMSRVCGICPVSHVLASSKAGDMLLGVEAPPAAQQQRRLLNYAQILQSHALSFFHLSSPDLLLGMDAPPAQRNIFGLLQHDADFLRRGIRLRQFGQRVIELVGGKKVHPGWSGPGGVQRRFTSGQRDEILTWIPEATDSVLRALERGKSVLDSFRTEIEFLGNFPSLFLGTVNEHGGLEYYDGLIRIVDGRGNSIAENLDPKRYATYLGEASEDFSFVKFPYYQPFGYPQGHYRVGPLARLNVAAFAGTPLADRELREFKQRGAGAVCESFHYHLARLIEMLHCVERIEELMAHPDLFEETIQAHASLNRREGVGSCEAPRGTLFHHYWVDPDGLMTRANLLIATSQNNRAMNLAVDQAARRFLTPSDAGGEFEEGMLNRLEAAIRCYDPCLSCSTHALGQMPLVVEVFAPNGDLVRRIARPPEQNFSESQNG